MRSVRLIMFFLFVAALGAAQTACAEGQQGKDAKTHTVDWYMAPENKAALEAKLKECRNNPGELKNTAECQNAVQADLKLFTNQPGINIR